MKRKDRFDYIPIETTGLGDPAPVAQTFFIDDEMRSQRALDGIVTIVDAKHIWQHIDDSSEAQEQTAFADVILLNKIDLAPPPEVDRIEVISKIYKPNHKHDDEVASVGIPPPGDLDEKKLNNWLRELLMSKDPHIFRMKGFCRSGVIVAASCFRGCICSLTGGRIARGEQSRGIIR
jgi:G3E family GTPase